jgi:tyrosyl-tRNA synthetase
MTTDERLKLVKEVGEEIVTESELKKLLQSGQNLVAYDGFEPSGEMHIAQGLLRTITVNKMISAGFKFKMLVADWHAMANKKLDGDLEKIQTVGKYFIEVWRACGMDQKNVEFVWASDVVKNPDYWKLVLQVAKTNSYKRFIRTAEIMGRQEDERLTAAQIIYSCMQCADIFTLGVRVAQLGMDQRKVNVLAREIGPQLGFWKPVIVSHHMILGLGKPPIFQGDKLDQTIERKMSKSNPDSAILMTDTLQDIERKITKAYCPEGQVEDNPVMEYLRYIVFEMFDHVSIARPYKFGGTIEYDSYLELAKEYVAKKIHPADIKAATAKYINQLLEPVRNHFDQNPYAKTLLDQVKSFKVAK